MKRVATKCLIFVTMFVASCQQTDSDIVISASSVDSTQQRKNVYRNGKLKDASKLEKIFTKNTLDSFPNILVNPDIIKGLIEQEKLLKYRRKKQFNLSNISISKKEKKETVQALKNWSNAALIPLSEYVDAYQISGEDKKGNVLYTGYYSPVIKVDAKKSEQFPFAIYQKPKEWVGEWPTRALIDTKGALDGLGLEIAYAESLLDIYMMQMQGSGYIEYPNGSTSLLSFGGTNRKKSRNFRSYALKLQREIIKDSVTTPLGVISFLNKNKQLIPEVLAKDPAYVFFQKNKRHKNIRGAGNVPLLADHSIAVDPRFIPLGSCMLGAIPKLDKNGSCTHHDYKILLAQDVGGAIKGPGHIDLYCGIGKKGKEKTRFKHYGQLWLLRAK